MLTLLRRRACIAIGIHANVAKSAKCPDWIACDRWMLRVGTSLVLRTDPELVLYGRHVRLQRLINEGFQFAFTDLSRAFEDLC